MHRRRIQRLNISVVERSYRGFDFFFIRRLTRFIFHNLDPAFANELEDLICLTLKSRPLERSMLGGQLLAYDCPEFYNWSVLLYFDP